MTYRHLLFIGLCCLSAFAWWLGGYNFNERGFGVAIGFIVSLIMIAILGTLPVDSLDEKIRNK